MLEVLLLLLFVGVVLFAVGFPRGHGRRSRYRRRPARRRRAWR